jgi:hypothetical protein
MQVVVMVWLEDRKVFKGQCVCADNGDGVVEAKIGERVVTLRVGLGKCARRREQ